MVGKSTHARMAALLAMGMGLNGFVCSGTASAQHAGDSATAQALFEEARALMSKGNYAAACPKLEESQRIDPGSGTLLNLGDCYEKQNRTASAWSMFLEAAASAKASGNAVRERAARKRASAVSSRLAQIAIHLTNGTTAGLEVRRDDTVVRSAQWDSPIPADPGPHTIVASAPGHQGWKTTVILREGATETVVVPELASIAGAPEAKSDAPSSPNAAPTNARKSVPKESKESSGLGTQRIVALAAGGVGVVGVVVGGLFGASAKSQHDASQGPKLCSGNECKTQEGVDLLYQARETGGRANIAFAVGAVGLATGTLLWITAPSGPQVGVGVGTLQIKGAW